MNNQQPNQQPNLKLRRQPIDVRKLARTSPKTKKSALPPQSEFLKKPFPVSGKKWDQVLQTRQPEPGDLELSALVAPQSPSPLSSPATS